MKTILDIQNLKKDFITKKPLGKTNIIHAVKNVSFAVKEGESIGLAGESGSGKTTIGKIIVKLEDCKDGKIYFKGKRIDNIKEKEFIKYRKEIQMIFQNPFASMNPGISIEASIKEAPIIHKLYTKEQLHFEIDKLLEQCSLKAELLKRRPYELSGGQLQRFSIIRALLLKPKLLIADEIVTALDVPVQVQIINLLNLLRKTNGFSMLFISHDLSVMKKITDKIIVLKNGSIVEKNNTAELFKKPLNPYTKQLINSIPKL